MTEAPGHHFHAPYDAQPKCDPERVKRLEYHLASGDYFPLLATVFGFLEEGVQRCEEGVHEAALIAPDMIRGLREDLLYLHQNYRIQPKNQ